MKTKEQKYRWILENGQDHRDWGFYNEHPDLWDGFTHKFLDNVIKEIKNKFV
jgi:hypothetical protein